MKHERDFQHFLVYVYGFFTTIVAFWVYIKTLAPTVSFFDSGELISAAYTLGVAHPPGYPLYVTLGWVFSKLPFGVNIAYRLNLMSAFFAALATLMVYCLTYSIITDKNKDLTGFENLSDRRRPPEPKRMLQPIVAMSAAFSFAFSIVHWRHAVIAEVYSLNAFLCGLIVFLLLIWRKAQLSSSLPGEAVKSPPGKGWGWVTRLGRSSDSATHPLPIPGGESVAFGDTGDQKTILASPDPRTPQPAKPWLLYLVAFLFGLGFGNHQTIILLSIAACFIVFITTPQILRRPRTILLVFLALLLGLSIYVMVPVRAAQNPPINWGNPATIRQFKWLLTREGYQNVLRGDAVKTLWNDLRGQSGDAVNSSEYENAQGQSTLKGFERISQIVTHSLFWKQLQSFDPLAQFGYLGMTLALAGLIYGLATHRIATLTLLIGICSWVVIVVLIGDPPPENIFLVEEFHTPAYLLMAVWIGLGIMACSRAVLWVAFQHRILQYALVFVLAAFFLIPPCQSDGQKTCQRSTGAEIMWPTIMRQMC